MSSVTITDACFRYGTTPVFEHLNVTLTSGHVTAILGASGSGKSTLLRCIAGHERLQQGSIHLGETVVDDAQHWIKPEQRPVGLVFQDLALFPHLTVAKNIVFGLKNYSRADKQRRLTELLEQLELSEFAYRQPHQLSGGQQQRVALARALAPAPQLLLLDEPFTSLDPVLRDRLREDLMQVIRASGTTCLLVTHDPQEAVALADHLVVLEHGKVIQAGPPHAIIQQPQTPSVLALFGRVNLLQAQVNNGIVTSALGSWTSQLPDGTIEVHIREDAIALSPLCDFDTQEALPSPLGASSSGEGIIIGAYDWGHHARYQVELPTGEKIWALQLDAGHHAPGSRVSLQRQPLPHLCIEKTRQ
jgi:iron(III) transport system ATP-binding protein